MKATELCEKSIEVINRDRNKISYTQRTVNQYRREGELDLDSVLRALFTFRCLDQGMLVMSVHANLDKDEALTILESYLENKLEILNYSCLSRRKNKELVKRDYLRVCSNMGLDENPKFLF